MEGIIVMKCPKCGQIIIDSKPFCVNCGTELNPKINGVSGKMKYIFMGLSVFLGLVMFLGVMVLNTSISMPIFGGKVDLLTYMEKNHIDYEEANAKLEKQMLNKRMEIRSLDKYMKYYEAGGHLYVTIEDTDFEIH